MGWLQWERNKTSVEQEANSGGQGGCTKAKDICAFFSWCVCVVVVVVSHVYVSLCTCVYVCMPEVIINCLLYLSLFL